ncbi:MAG: formate dehydrogenase accessory protein FdhE [Chloroflexota bacterium]
MALAMPWARHRERAATLRESHPHAAEMLALYEALAGAWETIGEQAGGERPDASQLPGYVAGQALPLVVGATLAAGPPALREAVSRSPLGGRGRGADTVAAWLAGRPLPATDRYLARASAAPILEVLPELAVATGRKAEDARHCPTCGGAPQLSCFGASDEALVTAPRWLLCSRCSALWTFPRLVCAGCGNQESTTLPIYSDPERLPGLRVDACEACRQYLVTIELAKDPAAVPVVDELVALPLDLYARERGFSKITPNLMGI